MLDSLTVSTWGSSVLLGGGIPLLALLAPRTGLTL
jgi:hypothetical protein